MPTALSPHNPRLAALRDLLTPRGRRAAARFGAEGATLLAEADRAGLLPQELFATPSGLERFDAGRYEAAGIPVFEVPDRAFARLSDLDTPSGILGIFPLPDRSAADVLALPGLLLVLAGVSDPGNAGTLVRSAEAFGASAVLTTAGTVSEWNQKALRASAGSVFRVPVVQAAAGELAALKGRGVRILAAVAPEAEADPEGDAVSVAAHAADLTGGCALMIGNEGAGLSAELLAIADARINIPTPGRVESLNAAVAGSLLLYEASRQRTR